MINDSHNEYSYKDRKDSKDRTENSKVEINRMSGRPTLS